MGQTEYSVGTPKIDRSKVRTSAHHRINMVLDPRFSLSDLLHRSANHGQNVMKELLRWEMRHAGSESEFELADDRVDLEALLVNQQRRQQVDRILEELPKKDRELLRMLFLEECDKSEICKRFKVREDYLRVLLHRAKLRFRSMHSKRSAHV